MRATTACAVAAACLSVLLTGCGSSTRHSSSGDDVGAAPPPVVIIPPTTPPLLPPAPPTTPPTTPPVTPPVLNVVVSGVVTFDRVPFKSATGAGLDFAATTHAPVRGATVEAVASSGGAVLALTKTSATGTYSITVPVSQQIFLRVKAELLNSGSPSWNVRVRDNTNADALYALDSAAFNSGTGAPLTRDLNAASGWGTTSYVSARSAAPFALLDVAYDSMQLVLSGNANVTFPNLVLFWSPQNAPVDGNIALGEIGTTFFEPQAGSKPAAIYVLGEADTDTDEFDRHVIAHEWGHYYQSVFGRDDTIGGPFDPNERLDLRLAFSEGWAYAFSGMVNADPIARDSFGAGQGADDQEDLESLPPSRHGWYSIRSIAQLLYDLYDDRAGDDEMLHIGFGPFHTAMVGLGQTHALTGIHPFLSRVRAAAPAQAANITARATAEQIVIGDDFGAGETNSAGNRVQLPLYASVQPGQTTRVCSTGGPTPDKIYNKLGNSSLLKMTLASNYSGTLTARRITPGSDPDILIYRDGELIDTSEQVGSETLPLVAYPAGTYVLETYDISNIDEDFSPPIGPVCIDVSLTP